MKKQLEMKSRFLGKVTPELEINSYMDNNRMYIGLVETGWGTLCGFGGKYQ
jgi:hypothetical protein